MYCPNCKSEMEKDESFVLPVFRCKKCGKNWEIYETKDLEDDDDDNDQQRPVAAS